MEQRKRGEKNNKKKELSIPVSKSKVVNKEFILKVSFNGHPPEWNWNLCS